MEPTRREVLAAAAAAAAGCAGRAEPEADNPWGSDPVAVDVRGDSGLRRLARDALSYWEGPGARHHDHDVDFDMDGDGEADLLVKSGTGPCREPMTAGCYVEECRGGDCEYVIAVDWSDDDEWRLRVLKHELGHALGLEHGEGPDFMESHIRANPAAD